MIYKYTSDKKLKIIPRLLLNLHDFFSKEYLFNLKRKK